MLQRPIQRRPQWRQRQPVSCFHLFERCAARRAAAACRASSISSLTTRGIQPYVIAATRQNHGHGSPAGSLAAANGDGYVARLGGSKICNRRSLLQKLACLACAARWFSRTGTKYLLELLDHRRFRTRIRINLPGNVLWIVMTHTLKNVDDGIDWKKVELLVFVSI